MALVGLLTEQEKDLLINKLYAPDSFFNPIQDLFDQWVISTQEIDQCENIEFIWVKDLPLITYQAKTPVDPF